jgi:hypothetical protein
LRTYRELKQFLLGETPHKEHEARKDYRAPMLRHSALGRYGFSTDGVAGIRDHQLQPGARLAFDQEFMPGVIKEVWSWPQERPDTEYRCLQSFWGFPGSRPVEIDPTGFPDFIGVLVDPDGTVRFRDGLRCRWGSNEKMDFSRMQLLASFGPTRTILIRIGGDVTEASWYVAFQYRSGLTVLTSPAKANATYYSWRDQRIDDYHAHRHLEVAA